MSCADFKWMQCLVTPNYRIETRKYLASLISRYSTLWACYWGRLYTSLSLQQQCYKQLRHECSPSFSFPESRWDTDIFSTVCIFSFPLNAMSFHFIPFFFIPLYSFLFCSFSPDQPQKKSELQTPQSHLNCVDETENLHIQADSGQSTAEERNFPQGSLQPIVATVEQLTAEEKNHPPGDEGSNRWWYHPGREFEASC